MFEDEGVFERISIYWFPSGADHEQEYTDPMTPELSLQHRRMLRYWDSTRTAWETEMFLDALGRHRQDDGCGLVEAMKDSLREFQLMPPPQYKHVVNDEGTEEWYSFKLCIRHTTGHTETFWCHNFTECYMTSIDCIAMYHANGWDVMINDLESLTFEAEEFAYLYDDREGFWRWRPAVHF
jgi:hypothetical protein